MVGLPVTFLLCLETHFAFSSQLENEVALLVEVCQLLEFSPRVLRVLHQRSINEVAYLSAFIDIESLETLAAIETCIANIPFHDVTCI